MTTAAAAKLEHVSLELGTRRVLRDVSLTLPDRGLSAIIGPNGCGKSTITRMLTAFIFPTSGSVELLGHRLGEINVHHLRQHIRLVQPSLLLEPDERASVREIVETGAFGTVDLHDVPTATDRSRCGELIEQFGLTRVAESPFRICSSGERMRAQLARAMISRPRLLILDEPTSGLDIPARERLLATIETVAGAADAPAVLIVTHHVEELPPATQQVILMRDGALIAMGSPTSVLTSEQMSAAFDYPIEVTQRGGYYAAHVARGRADRFDA